MHVSRGTADRSARRGALVLLVLTLLLAVVAVASSGHVPLGSSRARRPSELMADTVVSLVLVVVLAGSALIFYVYYLQRTNSHQERRSGRAGGSRRSLVVTIVFAVLALATVVRTAIDRWRRNDDAGFGGTGGSPNPGDAGSHGYTPHFATVPVAVILAAVAIVSVAAYLSARAGRSAARPTEPEPPALTLADVLGETLDDLRAEPNPRVAVIAAYARLERTLSAFGVPRRESDAPEEYLRRILVDLKVGSQQAARLTQLFEHAKFSLHTVGPELKEEAIVLLEAIRADLQAAEQARLALPSPSPAGQTA